MVGLGVLGEVLYVVSAVKGGGYQDCVLVGLLVTVSVGGWWVESSSDVESSGVE